MGLTGLTVAVAGVVADVCGMIAVLIVIKRFVPLVQRLEIGAFAEYL